MIEAGPGEIYLRCPDCQRRTAGWQLGPPPMLRFAGDPDRHRMWSKPVMVLTAAAPEPEAFVALDGSDLRLIEVAGSIQ